MTFAARRTTELGLLVLGTMFVVGAYALASVPEESDIPATVGPFLGIAVGLPIAAHVAVRRLAPQADGMLLPLASLLNGLGYVFIVRLDEGRADPQGLAGLQSLWMVVGVAAFVATLLFLRDIRTLERYRYTAGFLGLVLLLLPLLPGIGQTIYGSRIWVSFGPVNFQPGEFAKLALAIFFAGYLVEKRELLAINRAFGPFALPDPKHLGPDPARLGGRPRGDGGGEGPGLVPAVLHPVPGAHLGGDRAGLVPGGGHHAVPGGRLHRLQRVRPRPRALRRVARTPGRPRRATRSSRPRSPSRTAAPWAGASASARPSATSPWSRAT